jgi:uncharacterized protein with LGFP repeats
MAVVRKPKETITVNAKDITWIKDTLNKLTDKVDAIDKTTTKLNTTIVGDDAYGQVGLVTKVKEHTDYIETDKTFKSKLVGGSIVIGVLWTVIIKFWDKIF